MGILPTAFIARPSGWSGVDNNAKCRIDALTHNSPFSGLFEHFSNEDYRGSGHINPMTMHELMIIADGVGAKMLSVRTLCQMPWLTASRRVTTVLTSLVSAMLRPFMGRNAGGDVLCAVLQKPQCEIPE